MKKLFVILSLGFLGLSLHAQITAGNPVYEPFNYTPGDNLAGQMNAQGLAWAAAGTSSAHQPIINSGNLSYPGLLSPTGNCTSYGSAQGGSGDSARLGLGGSISSTGTTVYYSMIVQVTQLGTLPTGNTGVIVAGLNNSTGSSSSQPGVIGARLCMRLSAPSATTYNFGLDKSGSGAVWDTGLYSAGDIVFVVGSYTFNGGNGDSASLWINPSSSTFGTANIPTPTVTDTTGGGISAVASFLLREAASTEPDLIADELRVGVDWADVTPPEPVTPSFSNLAASPSTAYGSSVILSGTVSGPGPIYPSSGETITVTVNGDAETTTIDDSAGDFSLKYNPSNTPVSGSPYMITYAYGGDTFLNSASDTSTSLTITQLPVFLSGSRAYDGTATAASGILSVANKVGTDDVTVASGSANLAGANVGGEAITSPGTLALGGTTAGNYTLTGASGLVSVFITMAPGLAIYEPFANASSNNETTYAVGSNLIGQTSAQGLTWYSAGPVGNQPQPVIASGNLSVSGLVASSGNSVSYGNGNGDSARLGLGNSVASGTLYYSLILQVTSLGNLTTSGAIMGGFNNSTGSQTNVATTIATRLELRLSGSGYNIGLDKTGTGLVWDSGVHNVGETVFIVGSYTFNTVTTNDDVTSLWIDPSSSTFGAGSAPTANLASSTGSDISEGQIASFLLREGTTNEPPTTIDELRVGLTWADVTPSVAGSSTFSITAVNRDNTGSNIVITWQSQAGTNYQVVGTTNLGSRNAWTNVGSPITASATTTSATNPIAGSNNFFRVKSP